jgi:hypothetical protein
MEIGWPQEARKADSPQMSVRGAEIKDPRHLLLATALLSTFRPSTFDCIALFFAHGSPDSREALVEHVADTRQGYKAGGSCPLDAALCGIFTHFVILVLVFL